MSDAPGTAPSGGLITFLFTDVVGSTAAWEAFPDAMARALERHDDIVEGAVTDHGGSVVRPRGEGDSRFAVFDDAASALAAAPAIAKAIAAEGWPPDTPITLRIAVHSGPADLRAGDYYGSAVNRCARLRSIANPGQVLVSEAAVELARPSLDPSIRTVDLGVHWLKDLAHPERVFQLVAAGMATEHPPLRSVGQPDAVRTAPLPIPTSSLVGRQLEVAALAGKLREAEVRLLTLIGPGGVGKTRLAIEAASAAGSAFPGGIAFVGLASVEDPELMMPAVAQALDVPETGEGTSVDAVVKRLGDKRALLVLDNLEQLSEGAPAIAQLLRRSPGLKVLATSRVALRLSGEVEYVVPSLSLPPPGGHTSLEALSGSEAVQLFLARSRALVPSFELTPRNADPIAEICNRLDGLPLALELAAARIKMLSPADLLSRLDHCLQLLTGGSRDLPDRQRTMRATLEWSSGLLQPAEQRLLAGLGTFVGTFSLEAAEAACADGDDIAVLDGLGSLVDNSLVRAVDDSARLRFRLLQTVREYALERLRDDGRSDDLHRRHADHFQDTAVRANRELDGPDGPVWLAELTADEPNHRAALGWALDHGQVDRAGRHAAALRPFWVTQGRLDEGRSWLESVLANSPGTAVRGRVLVAAGILAYYEDDCRTAIAHLEQGIAECQKERDAEGVATGSCYLGISVLANGDPSRAATLAADALAMSSSLGLYESQVLSLSLSGMVAALDGDFATEKLRYERRLELAQSHGDRGRIADTLNTLAEIALDDGELGVARDQAEEALELARMTSKITTRDALVTLGRLWLAEGDADRAHAAFEHALDLCVEFGQTFELGQCLRGLASTAAVDGEALRAARLYGAAHGVLAPLQDDVFPLERELEEHCERARSEVGAEAFDTAWADGAKLSRDAVLRLARIGPTSRSGATTVVT
jgi:predicted ATPase/class 3 adenylate cyclase